MADLLSPGISVTVTDESFYIPATATTIPLIFIATKEGKLLSDGSRAVGTFESNVIRTVTSLSQSKQLYGIPSFLIDSQGLPLHGDARNEYGVFALNQFLRVGNLAYVVRANIDLDDERANVLASWNEQLAVAHDALVALATALITDFNNLNGYSVGDPLFKETINQVEFLSLASSAMSVVYGKYAFRTVATTFEGDLTGAPLPTFENGYNYAPTGSFIGLAGAAAVWIATAAGSVNPTQWTPAEAAQVLVVTANVYQFTADFLSRTTLGANDAARRVAIVAALQSSINTNEDIRAEEYEYNLIVAPGYYELVDELAALNTSINEEAFVIGDTPFSSDPNTVVTPWAASSSRIRSYAVAYYYPPLAIASNLDGVDVACTTSGVALAAYTNSDNKGYIWAAPGGVQRTLLSDITGITQVGFVQGVLGEATTFVDVHLNRGQRDNLYHSPVYINPIINSPGTGLALWGQRVSVPGSVASARDRVAVARTIAYIKRNIRKFLVPFLFEPNDKITRDNVKSTVDNFLHDIMSKRGLYDFATVCDTSNNTGDRIDRNELWIDIALKPMHSVEFIYVPIRVLKTSASFN